MDGGDTILLWIAAGGLLLFVTVAMILSFMA
jgi:hypothetical protein